MTVMSTVKAEVRDGRAVVQNLDEYPDGTVVELAVVSDGELTAAELEDLDDVLEGSRAELEAGLGVPAEDVIRELRAK